jgi:glycosyltransferase involved in cell wall biosynthesis
LQEEALGMDLVVAGNFPATLWTGLAKKRTKNFPLILWYANEPPRTLYEEVLSHHFLQSKLDPKFYFPWTKAFQRMKNRRLVELDQEAVSYISKIAAISKQTSFWIERIYHREAPVVYLGIADMEPVDIVKPLTDSFILFSPAGLEPIKNFQTVLEAFCLFLKKQKKPSKARLWITGDGPWKMKAQKLAEKLKISEFVEWLGILSREALLARYRTCSAVVFIPFDEPFGLVSCEAGLAGKPVIASRHGGPAEVVLPQATGFLVDPLDAEEVAEAIFSLAQNLPLCEKFGKAGLARIREKFNLEVCLNKLENLAFETQKVS